MGIEHIVQNAGREGGGVYMAVYMYMYLTTVLILQSKRQESHEMVKPTGKNCVLSEVHAVLLLLQQSASLSAAATG